ncbi:uncharacterized protein LOC144798190 [Lissotriton helveticus]
MAQHFKVRVPALLWMAQHFKVRVPALLRMAQHFKVRVPALLRMAQHFKMVGADMERTRHTPWGKDSDDPPDDTCWNEGYSDMDSSAGGAPRRARGPRTVWPSDGTLGGFSTGGSTAFHLPMRHRRGVSSSPRTSSPNAAAALGREIPCCAVPPTFCRMPWTPEPARGGTQEPCKAMPRQFGGYYIIWLVFKLAMRKSHKNFSSRSKKTPRLRRATRQSAQKTAPDPENIFVAEDDEGLQEEDPDRQSDPASEQNSNYDEDEEEV